jgi:hypothetical protein
MVIATVTETKGTVFVKDIAGNITALKAGDTIESGDIVFGADADSGYTLTYAESGNEQLFIGMAPQLFDITMIPSLATIEEGSVDQNSANPFAQSILSADELAALMKKEGEEGEEIVDETAAGNEEAVQSESTGDTFAERSNAMTDINSDLRKAKFFGVSHDYQQEDLFRTEDTERLETVANANQTTISTITPSPQPITTTVIEKPLPTEPETPKSQTPTAPAPEPTANISISSIIVNEATGTATVTVTLSTPSSNTITVNYATEDGIARAGADYTATNGTLIFGPGERSKTITVPISNDTLLRGE